MNFGFTEMMIITWFVPLVLLFFVIRFAVKSGVKSALKEYHTEHKKDSSP